MFRSPYLLILLKTYLKIKISTKTGNVVVISEEYYNGLMETLYLSYIPNMKETIIEVINTPIEECISENEIY